MATPLVRLRPAPSAPPVPSTTTSPVARCLQSLLTASREKKLPCDLRWTCLEGLLALMATHPFDPNERFDLPWDHEHQTVGVKGVSLLEAVLSLAIPHAHPWPREVWPSNTAAFDDALLDRLERRCVGVEWAAAALLAAGANPWVLPRDQQETIDVLTTLGMLDALDAPRAVPWPMAVSLAMYNGHAGLLAALLDCPGAWSAAEVLARCPQDVMKRVLQSPGSAPCLGVLFERGGRLSNPTTTLAPACGDAIEAIALARACDTTDDQREHLRQHWKTGRLDLSVGGANVEAVAELWAAALKKGPSVGAVAFPLAKVLGCKVDALPPLTWPPLGSAGWDDRCTLTEGALAGQWNLLATVALATLKSPNDPPVSIGDLVVSGAAGRPLAASLGLDWRPGIPIDGLVALALFSAKPTQSPGGDHVLERFARAAGIEDLEAWARASVPSALAFTQAIVKGRSADGNLDASPALVRAWRLAIERWPAFAQGLSAVQTEALLGCLTEVDYGGYIFGRWGELEALGKMLCSESDRKNVWSLPAGPRRRLAMLVVAFSTPLLTFLETANPIPWTIDPTDRAWLLDTIQRMSWDSDHQKEAQKEIARMDRRLEKQQRLSVALAAVKAPQARVRL